MQKKGANISLKGYNPSLKLAIDIARVVEAPIEEIFVFKRSVRN